MELLKKTIRKITAQDAEARSRAKARLDKLTMPHWALGRLMDLALDLAGISGKMDPPVGRKAIITMAGDHGVVEEGVSLFPQEVTPQMVYNFVRGGAGINALARAAGARVIVVDMGMAVELKDLIESNRIVSKSVARGTKNMAKGAAMSREEAVRAIEGGIEVVEALNEEVDLFGTGDMGIGNTTPSAAILAAVTGRPVEEVTGLGTGINIELWQNKVNVIRKALEINRPDPKDGIDILSKVGGFEIGGIAGVILGCAARRKPVIVDGFISSAGAIIAELLAPLSMDYVIAAHRSKEKAHTVMLQYLGKDPLLDLNLRLGEGTGAALAMNLVEASYRVLTEVATFEEAQVSDGN